MNAAPMILRFCSGSVTPARRSRNRSHGVHELERQLQALEARPDLLALRPAAAGRCPRRCRSADRRSPGAAASRRPSNRRRRTGRTRRGRSPTCSRMRADALVDERRHRPVAAAAADAVREVPEDVQARVGVRDFRVEQQPVELPRRVLASPRPARWRRRRHDEARRARPRRSRRGWPRPAARRARSRRAARPARCERRVAELALRRRLDSPAERVGHELHAVADAEDGHASSKTARIAARRAGLGHALRAAREDDARPAAAARSPPAACRRQDLGVDRQLAQPARNQLRVLRAEIENDDGLMCHVSEMEANSTASPIEG